MLPQHRETIDGMERRYRADPDLLALLVIGSIARGEATEHSDVDAIAILADDAFARRFPTGRPTRTIEELSWFAGDPPVATPWPKATLSAAARRGPEPARFAFVDVIIVFSRDGEIDALLPKIAAFPEHEREEKLASFAAQLPIHLSFLVLADYSENPYLLTDTSHELALFGGRLILSHNRLLYPGRKQFMRQLERASDAPDHLPWLMRRLLRQPSIPTANNFCDAILAFHEWPQPAEGQGARYLHDRDEAWLWRPPALADS